MNRRALAKKFELVAGVHLSLALGAARSAPCLPTLRFPFRPFPRRTFPHSWPTVRSLRRPGQYSGEGSSLSTLCEPSILHAVCGYCHVVLLKTLDKGGSEERGRERERERERKEGKRGERSSIEEIERRKPRGWYRGMENGRFRRCCFFCFRRRHEYSSTRICIGSRSRKRRTG